MSLKFYRDEGIVLKAIPYGEKDGILTLLTKHAGLLKCFFKGNHVAATPLVEAEYLFTKGKGDLFQYREGSVISQNMHLRTRYELLETAHKMSQIILESQYEGKSSEGLYLIFSLFLKNLASFSCLKTAFSIFLLKVLTFEGILQEDAHCTICGKSLEERWRFAGECYCKEHADPSAYFFSKTEEEQLLVLQKVRVFQEMYPLCFSDLAGKIEQLYLQTHLT